MARDHPKRKVLAKVVLQQPGRVPVTAGLVLVADIFILHFIQTILDESGMRKYDFSARTFKEKQCDL